MGRVGDVLLVIGFLLIFITDTYVKGEDTCSISLPQITSETCKEERERELYQTRQFYKLTEPTQTDSVPFPLLNQPFTWLTAVTVKDPINARWFMQYFGLAVANKNRTEEFTEEFDADPYDATSISQYKDVHDRWTDQILKFNNLTVRYADLDEKDTFKQPVDHWQDDNYFAEQRLAGLNPHSLYRVTPGWWNPMPVGCYKDRRTFKNLYHNIRGRIDWSTWPNMDKVIDECAAEATKRNYRYFAVQFYGECWGDERLDIESRLGPKLLASDSKCQNGVGGQKTNFVYKLQDSFSGMPWSTLRHSISPNFDWESEIKKVMDDDDVTLDRVIKDGHLFVLRYPLKEGLDTSNDLTESTSNLRTMQQEKTPIAFFVSKLDEETKKRKLVPLAIQTGHTPDSPVYTPEHGAQWSDAKLLVQSSDLLHAQMIEHLLKSHILLEPICVAFHRHISKLHPLHQILKYHCRGVIVTNAFGFPVLMAERGRMDLLFTAGNTGSMTMIARGYHTLTWDDLDFQLDIKKRGVDDLNALPYYPYRDDGKVIYDLLKKYTRAFVKIYYKFAKDVVNDSELQGLMNEISADGEGENGGKGMIKKFPAQLSSVKQLTDTLFRMIWLATVTHSVANYPVSVYGAMTFNMPTKLYDDIRLPPSETGIYRLPNIKTSAIQVSLAMGLGSLHFDSLLDYHGSLPDSEAKKVAKRFHKALTEKIEPVLRKRDKERHEKGQMTYPYMYPSYLANSIHT